MSRDKTQSFLAQMTYPRQRAGWFLVTPILGRIQDGEPQVALGESVWLPVSSDSFASCEIFPVHHPASAGFSGLWPAGTKQIISRSLCTEPEDMMHSVSTIFPPPPTPNLLQVTQLWASICKSSQVLPCTRIVLLRVCISHLSGNNYILLTAVSPMPGTLPSTEYCLVNICCVGKRSLSHVH